MVGQTIDFSRGTGWIKDEDTTGGAHRTNYGAGVDDIVATISLVGMCIWIRRRSVGMIDRKGIIADRIRNGECRNGSGAGDGTLHVIPNFGEGGGGEFGGDAGCRLAVGLGGRHGCF